MIKINAMLLLFIGRLSNDVVVLMFLCCCCCCLSCHHRILHSKRSLLFKCNHFLAHKRDGWEWGPLPIVIRAVGWRIERNEVEHDDNSVWMIIMDVDMAPSSSPKGSPPTTTTTRDKEYVLGNFKQAASSSALSNKGRGAGITDVYHIVIVSLPGASSYPSSSTGAVILIGI